MLWPRRDKATGYWTKLHAEELYDLFQSLNIIKVIQTGWWDGRGM
jgi:hypothetical protein